MTAPFTAMRFDVTCRACGGDLSLVNPGGGWEHERRCVTRCQTCRREYLLTVAMHPLRDVELGISGGEPKRVSHKGFVCPKSGVEARCGTTTGYDYGCREAECRAAHSQRESRARARREGRAA